MVEFGGGSFLLTNKKMASDGCRLILLRTMYTKCPTERSHGTRNFWRSMSGRVQRGSLSTITGTWPLYFLRIFCASAIRSSWDFSRLYLETDILLANRPAKVTCIGILTKKFELFLPHNRT